MGNLLPGQLAHVFLISIVDAALLSWLTLRWYADSMRKLMLARAAPVAARLDSPREAAVASAPSSVPTSLTFGLFGGDRAAAPPAFTIAGLRRVAIAYCLGAAVYSAVITALVLKGASPGPPAVIWFAEWWINAWPIVPTLIVLLVLDGRGRVRVAVGYLVIGALALAATTLAGQLVRGQVNSAPLTNMYGLVRGVVLTAYAPLILLAISAWRRVRAVTPLALAATLVFGFGSMFFRETLVAGFNDATFRTAMLDLSRHLSTDEAYYGLLMVVALPIGWLAWKLLGGLAASYERKRFSDVQLIIDCWWLIVTAELIVVSLATPYGLAGIGIGVAAFVVFRLTVALMLRTNADPSNTPPRRLLLLRVFGYQARTEALFDRVAQRWRFEGPVQLIAGVDLATRAVDPDDILAFLKGQLSDQYVASTDDVPRRLARLDLRRDPDGRFRVNELYCHDDTWKPTLQALLDASDGVLVDLRSFSERNSGCLFELEQIVRRIPTERVVLVCDRTTDLRLLGGVLTDAWARARREGVARGTGQVAVLQVERQSWREVASLTRCLLGIGAPGRVLAAAELPASF